MWCLEHHFGGGQPWTDAKCDEGGVRTHASEEIAALTQRLRPLGHLATRQKAATQVCTADVPKWLRGSPAKRVCSACAGSNPAVCDFYAHITVRCRPVVRIPGFHPGDPGSNPGGGVCLPVCVRLRVVSAGLVFSLEQIGIGHSNLPQLGSNQRPAG